MPDFRAASTNLPHVVLPALLLAAVSLGAAAGELYAQEVVTDYERELWTDGMKLFAYHPLTGKVLPTEGDAPVPYPFRGKAGDGQPDKVTVNLLAYYDSPEDPGGPTAEEIGDDLNWGNVYASVTVREGGRLWQSDDRVLFVERMELNPEVSTQGPTVSQAARTGSHEVDLPFDVVAETILQLRAILEHDGEPVDTFTTEIRLGMPELRFTSTITTEHMGGHDGFKLMTSTVSGRTGLEFSEGYRTLSGRGEATYDHFRAQAGGQFAHCTIDATIQDGYFEAKEIVLFPDSLPAPVLAPDPGVPIVPTEVVFFIEPGIEESLRISCPESPVSFPIPRMLNFFAGFYSIHGGQLQPFPNEMDEDRGGLVMTGWEPGEGDVIATKTYVREGPARNATLSERTTLELGWTR